MSFTEGRRRIVRQEENIEFTYTKIVAITGRNISQFFCKLILKSYKPFEGLVAKFSPLAAR